MNKIWEHRKVIGLVAYRVAILIALFWAVEQLGDIAHYCRYIGT